MSGGTHEDLIRDQFTRQATPFSTAASISDAQALDMVVAAGRPEPGDTVLDLACGGGLIVCAFAPHVRHATGIDLTPAMLDRARVLAAEKGVANVSWREGDIRALPWPDATFDIVVTRLSFHHLRDPAGVLAEMARVCRPAGRIVVVDMRASEEPAKAAAWNRLEKLRDPSHVRCLSLTELQSLFAAAGLPAPEVRHYELRDEVRNLLARSFPNPGDAERITALFAAQVERDSLGIEVRRDGDTLRYAYPVAILASTRRR
jgi:ubiquinone/menaquinone biosynthesis C-methylase UbiE